ncbi:MAG: phosphatase PAP2 family protein [Bacteroidales bacterium]
MLENILEYERSLFLYLNSFKTPVVDNFMWLYSGKIIWIPMIILFLYVFIKKQRWQQMLLVLIAIGLVILLCDQFASGFCKPLFHRFRPTHHPEFMDQVKIVFGYRGGRYGFISSHAANAFGYAMFIVLLFRNKFFSIVIFTWAVLQAYSRIYLGVHFITDIIPGIIVGLFFGWFVFWLFKMMANYLIGIGCDLQVHPYNKMSANILSYGMIIYIILMFVFGSQLVNLLYKF